MASGPECQHTRSENICQLIMAGLRAEVRLEQERMPGNVTAINECE